MAPPAPETAPTPEDGTVIFDLQTEATLEPPPAPAPGQLATVEEVQQLVAYLDQQQKQQALQQELETIFPYPMDELHVKDFMIRYRDLFGLSPEDVRVLQQLMKNQMASGTDILGRPLILPESAKISFEGIPTSSGEESFLDMSADEIQKIMQDEITSDLDLTTPRE